MAERLRLTKAGSGLYEEKRSRFIAELCAVADEETAKAFVTSVRKKYPDARHHVWAWILPDGSVRWSDDGEPGGTAGAPTADVLKSSGVFGLVCVTTRYFGGTLLGSGGLVRAYSKAAQLALADSETEPDPEKITLHIKAPWGDLDRVHRLAREYDAVTEADYTADPDNALLTVTVELWHKDAFCGRLTDVTGGRGAVFEPEE